MAEFSLESVTRELADMTQAWRRSRLWAALTSIAIGVTAIIGIYLAAWACCWLVEGRLHALNRPIFGTPLRPVPLALGGAWLLLGVVLAWRHVGPFEPLVPPHSKPYDPFIDPPLIRNDRGEMNLIDHGSVLPTEALSALVATGPRQVIEGIIAWRDIPTYAPETLDLAARLLHQAASMEGLTAATFRRDANHAAALGLLWRLALIRRDGTFVERWRIRTTQLGSDIAAA